MLNSITNHITYATQTAVNTLPKVPPVLQKESELDVFERSDGTTATRFDNAGVPKAPSPTESLSPTDNPSSTDNPSPTDNGEQQFRELLHQFIGQTLFGQMLKSMRATQEKNPFFHGGHSEEIYQSLLDMELTEQLTKSTSKTLSEPMYNLMRAPKAM